MFHPQLPELISDRSRRIAKLNDKFRMYFDFVFGGAILTPGIHNLSREDQLAIIKKVKNYSDFSEDNDPYGEHDFGSFTQTGHKIFWKIDYYDPSLKYHSEDPADDTKTKKVITVMHSSEY